MPNTSCTSRYAVAAIAGLATLSLAACGSSSTPSSSSSSKTSSSTSSSASASPTPNADKGKDRAFGLVDSVAGGTVKVTGKDGPATVNVTSSTHVVQFSPGQLTDVTAGQCIEVHPTKDGGSATAVTAADILFGKPDGTDCGHNGGNREHGVGGTVTSVSGSSIAVNTYDNGQATVTVTPTTHYTKRASADATVIAAGQCLAARGTKDGSGVLQASMAMVRPANNGTCGGGHPEGGHQGGGHQHN